MTRIAVGNILTSAHNGMKVLAIAGGLVRICLAGGESRQAGWVASVTSGKVVSLEQTAAVPSDGRNAVLFTFLFRAGDVGVSRIRICCTSDGKVKTVFKLMVQVSRRKPARSKKQPAKMKASARRRR